MPRQLRTVRVVEIAELLGVSHQRASKIVDEPGIPRRLDARVKAAYGIGVLRTAWATRWRKENRAVEVDPPGCLVGDSDLGPAHRPV